MVHRSATGDGAFGVGVGTLVLTVNVVLLGGYTFGCHSLRHLVGGTLRPALRGVPSRQRSLRLRELPEPPAHALGVGSLFWVALQRPLRALCSMGVWTDWRII